MIFALILECKKAQDQEPKKKKKVGKYSLKQ
jgi:hypothetical protein